MRISIKSELELGQIVDIELVERGQVEISHKGEVLETLPMVVFSDLFARRKKFKGKIVELNRVMPIRFYDLHRHSGYSLLDGMNKISAMVENTEYAGAISDHGVMYGVLEYYKKMNEAGKLPVLGFEAYTETIDGNKTRNHLLLLAKTEKGFKNLVKLTSLGYTNFYKKPQLNYDMLREYSEGIIVSTACMGGEVPRLLMEGKKDEAKKVCLELISIFGKENFYIEVQRHNIEGEDQLNDALVALAKELDVKVIATTDSHFTAKEDNKIHEILLCLQTKKTMDDPKRMTFKGTGYHLHTSEEMEDIWADMPEVLDNTLDLVESIDCQLELGKIYMPSFPVPKGFKDEAEYFEHLCWKGFEERFKGTDKFTSEEYKERLQFEINTIKNMGFPGYFVIVWDFVNFAKSRGILMGPGRGSACGSLVAYALSITEVDPIPYGLLFERFLNPDRVSMPDIDLDFDDRRREEVIDYVKGKYGEKSVSRIITFGTLAAKAVVRDVARVLGKPYALGDKISKSIPKTPKMTLSKAFEESQEFATMYQNDPEVREIVDIAMKLEGLPKNIGSHACGVIIAPSAVDNYIPQVLIEDDETGLFELTTQFTMAECEEMGLLKMDFLGLRTMGVIGRCLEDVNPKRIKLGLPPLTFMEIPTNDVRIYDFIAKGNTEGVFQLESPGMTSFMKELFQDVHSFLAVLSKEALYKKGEELFERAIAGISLYRPGPIDEIPNYIANMLNPEKITYEVPQLKPILDATYSVIVYQEQCMFIVRELAGFSKGMADTVRKAFSKKKEKMIAPLGEKFIYGEEDENGNVIIEGCIRRGIPEAVAQGIWDKMKKFGSYAFNKSHAGGYAEISIRTAWLAFYYPTEYMCATLNSFITKSDKIKTYLSVCKKKGIQVLPPHVNISRQAFTVDGEAIRFGLMGIKNMGKTSTLVMAERDERGEFLSFQDFAERMSKFQKVDKGVLEALVYSGAVDNFEGTRRAKLAIIPKLIKVATSEKKAHHSDQISLFDFAVEANIQDVAESFIEAKKIEMPDLQEFDKRYKLEKEKEFAGFYVTEHPLDDYAKFFGEEGVYEVGLLTPSDDNEGSDEEEGSFSFDGETIKIAGIVKDIKTFYTKSKNEPMNVFTIEDRTGEIKCVAFPKDKIKNEDKIVEGKIVILNGTIQDDERGLQIIVKTMIDVDAMRLSQTPDVVWVKGSNNRLWARKQWAEIKNLVEKNPGDVSVFFSFNGEKHEMKGKIKLNLSTICSIQELMGESNVKIMFKE
jgi:DNA-directed DNA polymerase III (polc)